MNPEEIEIKLDLINRDNYLKLIDHLGECQTELQQENIYIDTPDNDFKNAQKTVRIRKENDTVTVTVKGKSDRSIKGLVIRPEINVMADYDIYNKIKNRALYLSNLPREIYDQIGVPEDDKPLLEIVSFNNLRCRYPYESESGNYLLEVDNTEYPDGTTDYEIELELDDRNDANKALSALSKLLKALDIPVRQQNENKFARALKRRSPVE